MPRASRCGMTNSSPKGRSTARIAAPILLRGPSLPTAPAAPSWLRSDRRRLSKWATTKARPVRMLRAAPPRWKVSRSLTARLRRAKSSRKGRAATGTVPAAEARPIRCDREHGTPGKASRVHILGTEICEQKQPGVDTPADAAAKTPPPYQEINRPRQRAENPARSEIDPVARRARAHDTAQRSHRRKAGDRIAARQRLALAPAAAAKLPPRGSIQRLAHLGLSARLQRGDHAAQV